VFLRPPVRQPPHRQATDDAAEENGGERRVDVHLREPAIEPQIQRKVLNRATDAPIDAMLPSIRK